MDRETIKGVIKPVEAVLRACVGLQERETVAMFAEYRAEVARCWAALMLLRPDALRICEKARDAHWREGIANRKIAAQRAASQGGDLRSEDLAAAHFAMAGGISKMQTRLGRRINPYAMKEMGTLERHLHRAEADPVMALFLDGILDQGHLKAARDIAWVFEAVTAETQGKGGMDIGGGRAPQGSGRKAGGIGWAAAREHASIYLPWVGMMKVKRAPLEAVLGVVVHGEAVYAGARKARMSWNGFVEALKEALALYDDIATGKTIPIARECLDNFSD